MLALSRLLLDRADGPLTAEQEKQIGFIQKAAHDLSELVNDLLDLAKVEAGKVVARPVEFEVGKLFGALRGMLRPLLANQSVALVFEEPGDIPVLYTDESKVSQILRNFISNALKFTERGEVRVSAALAPEGDAVVISVADTGIGIAAEDHERIFQEFTQLESPIQRKVRGTGLGLPLTRKLAELLGGSVSVQSAPGLGSTFSARLPVRYAEPMPALAPAARPEADPRRIPVLVVEDSAEDLLVYENYLRVSGFQLFHAATTRQAREMVATVRPAALILDIVLRGEDAWSFLAQMKAEEATRGIPIIVATSVDDQHKGIGLGAEAYRVKPIDRSWLLETLGRLTREASVRRVLVIDDDEVARYLVRAELPDARYAVSEATNGTEGLRRAREERPEAIVLDLVMPGMSGLQVLEQLKAEPATSDIPVIVLSSKVLDLEERRRLDASAAAILTKGGTATDILAGGIRQALIRAGVG
jgi:CheY-like chemotaxis protein